MVRETRKAWYKLVGTVCVIMACVFTVAQMLDAVFHTGMKAIKKVRTQEITQLYGHTHSPNK